jgi:predicted GTPase
VSRDARHSAELAQGRPRATPFRRRGGSEGGKSSLLNALFGQEFCKVDVLPATDRIYIFKHGPREENVDVAAHVTERYQSIEFLRDFNVVDTPGTNTMVAEHQTITENFIPRADLVLFVFSVVIRGVLLPGSCSDL